MPKAHPLKKEMIAGFTTFFTMSYIIVVNPSILSTTGTGMPFSGVLTATVLLCFFATLAMGVFARVPFAIGPGMGLNAFFTYTLILRNQIPWPIALGVVFWSGVLFLICAYTPLRLKIASALPENLRIAASTGIGLFLTFIGLKNAGIVISDPMTLVKLGHLNQTTVFTLTGFGAMVILFKKKNPFSFLIGICLITVLSFFAGNIQFPEKWVSQPDFSSVLFKLDILGSFRLSLLPAIFALFFTDLFDSFSALIGCSYASGLRDSQGNPLRFRKSLIVSAWAGFGASFLGTSPGTTFIESAAGIEAGGRTGVTSVVTALCFLPCLFLSPLVQIVPGYATAPVLIIVGALMFRNVKELKLTHIEDLVPAFLTIILIPLTFSITQGILWGIISHVIIYFFCGKRKELNPSVILMSILSILLLILDTQDK